MGASGGEEGVLRWLWDGGRPLPRMSDRSRWVLRRTIPAMKRVSCWSSQRATGPQGQRAKGPKRQRGLKGQRVKAAIRLQFIQRDRVKGGRTLEKFHPATCLFLALNPAVIGGAGEAKPKDSITVHLEPKPWLALSAANTSGSHRETQSVQDMGCGTQKGVGRCDRRTYTAALSFYAVKFPHEDSINIRGLWATKLKKE